MIAPQIIMVVLMTISVVTHLLKNGEKTEYNVGYAFLGMLIEIAVLYWGGFWS